jgi:hypothetical protein
MVNCALRSLYAGKDIQVPVVFGAGGPQDRPRRYEERKRRYEERKLP